MLHTKGLGYKKLPLPVFFTGKISGWQRTLTCVKKNDAGDFGLYHDDDVKPQCPETKTLRGKKPISDMQPIAPTSSPTIGNTLVGGSLSLYTL